MSDANKDEARRCFELATEALQAGEKERAQRLLSKSLRLYPLDEARSLLDLISPATSARGTPTPRATPSSTPASSPAPKGNAGGADTPASTSSSTSSGSADQVAEVRRILKCTSYYEILRVEKTADTTEIKKAYRKLALSVHPDRNPVTGASDAFKKVGAAFACLSDEGKRREYDLTGRTDDTPRPRGPSAAYQRHGGGHYASYSYFADDDFDPFELFRQHGFFYTTNGAPTMRAGPRFRTHMPHTQQMQAPPLLSAIMQLAPLLILLMFAWFSLRSSSPKFSLERTMTHSYAQETQVGNVTFYSSERVLPSGAERIALDREVIQAYAQRLEGHCQHQRNEQARRDTIARWRGTEPEKVSLAACERLDSLQKAVTEATRRGIWAGA